MAKSNGNGTSGAPVVVRCAIYTRKSTEEGLNQDFNSLDAQMDAGEGWTLLPSQYDDGGFTGANMERPALRRLLADIARGVFTSVNDLARKLMRYIRAYSTNAKPFKWKYSDVSRRIKPC